MKANYHTHTWRCNHAEANERAYVETAIEGGTRILGFSDHTPYFFPGDYYSTFRMRPEDYEGYVTTVLDLRKEYADDITILLGLEVEYYPKFFPTLQEFLRTYPLDYMILGQHFIRNEIDASYSGSPTISQNHLSVYVDQVIEAMRTGFFTYLAHPDLLDYKGPKKLYQKEMRRLCQEAAALDIPLEINLLGIQNGRNYPDPAFWELVGETGNRVILGNDAHRERDLYRPDTEAFVMKKFVQPFHLNLIESVELRKPY